MAEAGGGGMAAVVGCDEATVLRVLTDSGIDELDLANYNAPDQFVLSGPAERVDAARTAFESAGVRAVRLNVSAPFHSRHMRDTAAEFARFLDGFTLRAPAVPVLANVDAQPYAPSAVKATLTAQIASPVRWTDTVRRLMGHGDFEFVELGPGRVLANLVAKIRKNTEPLPAPGAGERLDEPLPSGQLPPSVRARGLCRPDG